MSKRMCEVLRRIIKLDFTHFLKERKVGMRQGMEGKELIKEHSGRKKDVVELLEQGQTVQIKPQGYSMYPLFIPGRDEAVIAPVSNRAALKRGDVVLYRREGSILVLHRIWKRRGSDFYLVGDNQKEIEGPLKEKQIKGILVKIIRNGRSFSVKNPCYRLLSGIWLALRPVRPLLSRMVARIKRRNAK